MPDMVLIWKRLRSTSLEFELEPYVSRAHFGRFSPGEESLTRDMCRFAPRLQKWPQQVAFARDWDACLPRESSICGPIHKS